MNGSTVGPCLITAAFGVSPQVGGTYYLPISDLHSQSCFAKDTGYAQSFRSLIESSAGPPTLLPFVSSSLSRVYYLDGDTLVRYAAVDGSAGVAATVPGGANAHATFAVSPNDARIAVSVIDYSTSPPRMRMYVEDLASGGNHIDLFDSSSVYEWPVGWHGGDLVVAVGRAFSLGDAPNPYQAVDGYLLVDPATGKRISTIGSASCQVTGWLSPAGTACVGSAGIGAIDWSGKLTIFAERTGLSVGTLSPDGLQIAGCCSGTGESVALINASGSTRPIRLAGHYIAWADATRLLAATQINGTYTMVDLSSGALTPMHPMLLEGIFPGSLG